MSFWNTNIWFKYENKQTNVLVQLSEKLSKEGWWLLTTKWFIVRKSSNFKSCLQDNFFTNVFRKFFDQYLQTFLALVLWYLPNKYLLFDCLDLISLTWLSKEQIKSNIQMYLIFHLEMNTPDKGTDGFNTLLGHFYQISVKVSPQLNSSVTSRKWN